MNFTTGSVFNLFMYVRPTQPLHWWECGKILGGRDVTAGGTWLASNRQGRVAFVTNVRELNSLSAVAAKSRGDLPVRFLQSEKPLLEFAEETVKETDQYNGFNLLVADILSMNMVYVTNRPKGGSDYVTSVPPGVHVLSNASLDTPWPKAQRLEHGFKDILNQYGDGELPINEMVDRLMGNTVKDDLSKLPHIYSLEFEYQMSSVFVDGVSAKGRYGTRSTSALAVKASGEVFYYEKHLDNDLWKEQIETYMMEKNEK